MEPCWSYEIHRNREKNRQRDNCFVEIADLHRRAQVSQSANERYLASLASVEETRALYGSTSFRSADGRQIPQGDLDVHGPGGHDDGLSVKLRAYDDALGVERLDVHRVAGA